MMAQTEEALDSLSGARIIRLIKFLLSYLTSLRVMAQTEEDLDSLSGARIIRLLKFLLSYPTSLMDDGPDRRFR